MKFSLNKYSRNTKGVLLCCMLMSGTVTQAQQPTEKEKIFTSVEHMPQFSGDLGKYLAENIHYPQAAKKEQIQGRVVIQFVVDKEGNVTQAVLQRDIGGGCGEEAMRVVRNMPKWIPGKQGSRPVNVYYTLPVSFKLDNTTKTDIASTEVPKVFRSVAQMPQPSVDMGQYLATNLRYPDAARKAEVEGRVIAQFVIDEKGKINDPVILKGIHPDCNQEVLRVLRAMPDWQPGIQDGKAVKVYYTLPVSFKLSSTPAVSDEAAKIGVAAEEFKVYPNPATNEVYIENKSSLKIKQVTVYNATGTLMLTIPVNGVSRTRINTSGLLRGTYNFNIETDKGTVTKKVALQ